MAVRDDLHWQRFDFNPTETNRIPRDPGFFCFFVGPPPSTLPPVGYPLYLGKTDRTLRRRFAEYLLEQNDATVRPQTRNFLEIFDGELYFMCTTFTGTPDQIAGTARELQDALQPAFSEGEYEAEALVGQGAWA